MRDRPVIFAGLAVFLIAAAFPFWYNALAGRPSAPLALRKPSGAPCVQPAGFMRADHMRLLDGWRNSVVRAGERRYTGPDGKTWDMSLTRTCLAQCHQNRAEFCDRCHSYAGVSTADCWSCHDSPANPPRSAP